VPRSPDLNAAGSSVQPVSAFRLGTGGRPPLGLVRTSGKSGAISDQSSGGTNGFALLEAYRIPPGFCQAFSVQVVQAE